MATLPPISARRARSPVAAGIVALGLGTGTFLLLWLLSRMIFADETIRLVTAGLALIAIGLMLRIAGQPSDQGRHHD